ncbi:amidohydrolase [bacterium SCSIO 12741]|nr:amidohydrolase [bacterium SCSIO 12741]
MKNLRIAILQITLDWEEPQKNRDRIQGYFEKLEGEKLDVAVLPEMFTTGFTMNAQGVAEPEDGPTLQWMKTQAEKLNAAVTGSLIVKTTEGYFNRLYWVTPKGEVSHYDKRHLFRMAGEDKVFASGSQKLVVSWRGWRVCPLICYDLRFPVWSRSREDYDLLIYVANWPAARRNAWKVLSQARAIENLSPLVAVNRVGEDGNGISYAGDSAIYDAKGESLTQVKPHEEEVAIAEIDAEELLRFREKFPAHRDADGFTLQE